MNGLQSYQESAAATGSPRDTVNGFKPLFRPNNYDPVYTADAIRNSLPPGFKLSSASSVMTPNSYPALSAPAIGFTSPRQNDLDFADDEEHDDVTRQSIDEITGDGGGDGEGDEIAESSLKRPNIGLATYDSRRPNGGGGESEYEYYYEEEEVEGEEDGQTQFELRDTEDIKRLIDSLRAAGGGTTFPGSEDVVTPPSTDRSVPTLMVEEVTTTALEEDVTIAHRGTPTTTAPPVTTVSSTTSATSTTTPEQKGEGKEDAGGVEYEYEYYYEYYDEDGEADEDVEEAADAVR